MIAELSDADLILRMRNFEDHFVERKSSGDSKDWLKTVVAFANSAPNGYPCVLYLGVADTGEIEDRQANLDTLQRTFNREMEKIYPRVPYLQKIISEGGRQALAVIVLGSELRPHFAGPPFIRKGSETVVASADEFAEIASKGNEAYKQQVLELLRRGLFPGTRPVTGRGLPLVYEHELMEASESLRRLGEIRLHDLLLELRHREIIDCAEHEGNRWFACY